LIFAEGGLGLSSITGPTRRAYIAPVFKGKDRDHGYDGKANRPTFFGYGENARSKIKEFLRPGIPRWPSAR